MGICLIVKSGGGVDTSNATATADKILSGYTVYSNDNKITGTINNVGNQNITDTTWGQAGRTKYWGWPGGTIYIWGGWHDGTSGVDAWSLASQTGGCDIPGTDSCLKGYSYWNDGVKYDGTMPAIGTQNWAIGANGSQTISWGWHSGSGTVKQSLNVDTGEWWPTPTTSQQQLCWSGWYYSKNRGCWGDGNLTAGNIKKGISIFGVAGSCTTNYYLIKNGQLQVSNVTYDTVDSVQGNTPHYDSSLGAFVVYGTEWSSSGQSHLETCFPVFNDVQYPIVTNDTTQIGVVWMDFMIPSATQWASGSHPHVEVRCIRSNWLRYVYNRLSDYSGFTDAGNAVSGTRYKRPFKHFYLNNSKSRTSSDSIRIVSDFGRSACGPSKIVRSTYIYNIWVDTATTLTA